MEEKPNPEQEIIPASASPAVREASHAVWNSLSVADRRAVQELISAVPSETNLMRLLLRQATMQYRTAFGKKSRVAIVGPTNVGKSTLYNQFVQRKEDRAAVSPIPGTTRANQTADTGLFNLVDTPGADAVGAVGVQEQETALYAASEADFLIIEFDAIQGIKRTEQELFDALLALNKPYVVVMNKIDLVRRERIQVINTAAAALRIPPEQIVPIVARTGENIDEVLAAIVNAEPELVAALGQALPQYRWQLAWQVIVGAASASAAIALAPLPVIDFVPLTITQSMMILSIARIYNYPITLNRARELLVTFGLGFLGRTLFQQFSLLGGLPGWLLSASIATGTTVAMGYAASVWFETGQRLTSGALSTISREITKSLLESLRFFGRKKPDSKTLKTRITEALQKKPLKRPSANKDDDSVV